LTTAVAGEMLAEPRAIWGETECFVA
jgi:hypothetical protein